MSAQETLAAARQRFDAARSGRDRHGEMHGELLWLWSRDLGWSVVPLPPARIPAARPQAIRFLAKSVGATCVFLILEARMCTRRLGEDGSLPPVQPEEAGMPALLGILCTPDGDAMFLSFIESGACAIPVVRGDFVDDPLPPFGSMRGLMRPVQVDTTFN